MKCGGQRDKEGKMKWIKYIIFVVIAFAVAGCGGGGGGGGGGGSVGTDSFVVSQDFGAPTAYTETDLGGGFYDPWILSQVNSGWTMITLLHDFNPGIPNYDGQVYLTIYGTTTGDYPIGLASANNVSCVIGTAAYFADVFSGHAGTITVDIYDSGQIQGIFAANLEHSADSSDVIRLEGTFDLEPGM